MNCPACGYSISEKHPFCPNCGVRLDGCNLPVVRSAAPGAALGLPSVVLPGAINGAAYVIWSVVMMLFFLFPTGVAGLTFAARINPLQEAGDFEGARRSRGVCILFIVLSVLIGTALHLWGLLLLLKKYAG